MSSFFISLLTIINTMFTNVQSSTCTNCPLDLLVNGQHNPPHVVVLEDLKPGDDREVPKDLYANCIGRARIYLHLKDVVSSQAQQTEPEQQEEGQQPKFDLPNYIYYDLKLGNQTIIKLTDQIRFTDAVSCWIPIGVIPPKTHVPLYQSFHFDQEVTNWAQGDQTTFTEEFLAVNEANTELPVTDTGRVWDPTTKRCIQDPGCTFTQGYWKNHTDWPVANLTLGTTVYTKTQLLSIFGTPVSGNGLVSLAHQLIAAKLNVSSGAAVSASIVAADALIGSLVVPPIGAGFLAPATTSALTSALDNYNNGLSGSPHCKSKT